MNCSLVISTYNEPKELDLVLKSIGELNTLPDQILIADDGSTIETKQVVDKYKNSFNFDLEHVWHEDLGFRKSIILNKTIAKANFDYILQIDGDCILHPNFIENHLTNAKRTQFLYGSRVRVKLSQKPKVIEKRKTKFHFFSQGIKKRPRAIYCPTLNFNQAKLEVSPKFRGANCSYWRSDFIKVNGYNEDILGWGREDSELIIRLVNLGLLGKRLKFEAIVYHLDHKQSSKNNFDRNDEIQNKAIQLKKVWCENGIDKYLN